MQNVKEVTVTYFYAPVILPFIFKVIWLTLIKRGTLVYKWHCLHVQMLIRSLWSTLYAPVILPYICKVIWPTLVKLGTLVQNDSAHMCKCWVGHCDLYFTLRWFYQIFFDQFWSNVILWYKIACLHVQML